MNPRQYKKKAKAARDAMIRHYGFKASDFWVPRGKRYLDEFVATSQRVDGMEFDQIQIPKGCPVYLPDFTDYWGEANEPVCCISMLRETIFWSVCGEAYSRKELAS